MNKLKPCPFCGSVAELHTRDNSFEDVAYKKSEIPQTARLVCEKKYPHREKCYIYRKLLYIPRCTVSSCMGRSSKPFEVEQEAVDAWNMRAEEALKGGA